ncbi:MAG: PQQ-binding-like beta-propeller repeat protein [Pseudomonadota bacterium]
MTAETTLARMVGRLAAIAALGCLTACGFFDEEERLEGTRTPVRQAASAAEAAGAVIERALPQARPRDSWSQTGGSPAHSGGHISGPGGLSLAWTADAGTGSSSDSVVTAAPVVAGGVVYTLDAAAEVSAFDATSGALRWSTSLVPNEDEDGEEGFGGGLALDGDRLIATTGFGEILALSTATGEVLWRDSFGAPFRAAPAANAGRVVAVTRASQVFALESSSGQVLWRSEGVAAEAGWLGGASPAIGGGGAVVPYASGELAAFDINTGRRFWGAVISGGRRGLARAAITDLTGDPVLLGPLVIAANQSGRLAAFQARTGRRIWTRVLGATRPLWAAGDTLYLVSDAGTLLRLDASSGQTLWSRQLPIWEDEEDLEDPITYSGPVVTSGRVIVSDSIGQIWSLDAISGEGGVAGEIPSGSITGPVVAGGTLYLLSSDAVLHAFR